MLVTFSSPAYANIIMFGDVASQLLNMMGHSGAVPSALDAEDVKPALVSLLAAIEQSAQVQEPIEEQEDDNYQASVSIYNRALPLIELLRAAAKKNCHVMWDSNK